MTMTLSIAVTLASSCIVGLNLLAACHVHAFAHPSSRVAYRGPFVRFTVSSVGSTDALRKQKWSSVRRQDLIQVPRNDEGLAGSRYRNLHPYFVVKDDNYGDISRDISGQDQGGNTNNNIKSEAGNISDSTSEEEDKVVAHADVSSTNSSVVSPDPQSVSEATASTGHKSAIDVQVEPADGTDDDTDTTAQISDVSEEDERQLRQQRISKLRQRAASYVSTLPLSDIIRRLDKRGLRYAPSCSQEELEGMLADALVRERSTGSSGRPRPSSSPAANKARPPMQRGRGYDNSDIKDDRKSARRRKRVAVESVDDNPIGYDGYNPAATKSQYDRRRQRRRRNNSRIQQEEEPAIPRAIRDVAKAASRAVDLGPVEVVVSKTLQGVGSGVSKGAQNVGSTAKRVVGVTVDAAGNVVDGVGNVVGGVKNKARRRSRRVIRVDENGIAEPDWSYVRQEDNKDEENAFFTDTAQERIRDRPRRKRPPRRAASTPREVDSDLDGSADDDFTWYDYAVPFYTKAGPPGRRSRKGRQEVSTNNRSRRRRPRPRGPQSGDWDEDDDARVSRRPKPSKNVQSEQSVGHTPFILPPASSDATQFPSEMDTEDESDNRDSGESKRVWREEDITKRRRSRRRRDRGYDRERKIYSAWSDDSNALNEEVGIPHDQQGGDVFDRFDKFGNNMADAAESFLWGSDDDFEDARKANYYGREASRRGSSRRRPTKSDSSADDEDVLPPKRHWRDRLADRLDAAMGVHEQGRYYQEWADRVELEEETKVGTDPEDWVMGRHKNQRRMGLTPDERRARAVGRRGQVADRRRGSVDKYFWSQDGNLMSVLLGRSAAGEASANMERLFNQPLGVNIVSTLFRSAVQFSLALFTNACRWASVRGSLPQPIVVFFVSVALVCAPKGRRTVTTAITLLALRSLAEALHGYIFGDDGWEDDHDHLYYEDDAESSDSSNTLPDEGTPRRGRRRNSQPS